MRTRVKDFIEVSDHTSLDRLITTLVAIRDSLPPEAEPELKMRGDDVFGRRFSVAYFRELTAEEVEMDAKYCDTRAAGQRIEEIRAKLDAVPLKPKQHRRAA
jgi:hypothetical protein